MLIHMTPATRLRCRSSEGSLLFHWSCLVGSCAFCRSCKLISNKPGRLGYIDPPRAPRGTLEQDYFTGHPFGTTHELRGIDATNRERALRRTAAKGSIPTTFSLDTTKLHCLRRHVRRRRRGCLEHAKRPNGDMAATALFGTVRAQVHMLRRWSLSMGSGGRASRLLPAPMIHSGMCALSIPRLRDMTDTCCRRLSAP